MKRIFHTIILILCLCLYGCSVLWPEQTIFFDSYVVEYDNIDYSGEPELFINNNRNLVTVNLPTETYAFYAWEGISETWKDNPNWELWHERHRELSQKNGDVGFNMEWPYLWGPYRNSVWNTDNLISAITIVSDADYDLAHPAGVSLNDIVEISYVTHKPFIENEYRHMIVVDGVKQVDIDRPTNDYGGDVVSCILSDMQLPDDAIFMDSDSFSLRFTNQPTAAKNHTFTVTIEFEHSEPYSFTFDLNSTSVE